MPIGAQCSGRLATDQRSLACSGVHARQYGGGTDGACSWRVVVREGSVVPSQFDLPLFHSNFSRFKNESGPNFEYRSFPTSYNLQKCLRV
jgi:hypothetical protein